MPLLLADIRKGIVVQQRNIYEIICTLDCTLEYVSRDRPGVIWACPYGVIWACPYYPGFLLPTFHLSSVITLWVISLCGRRQQTLTDANVEWGLRWIVNGLASKKRTEKAKSEIESNDLMSRVIFQRSLRFLSPVPSQVPVAESWRCQVVLSSAGRYPSPDQVLASWGNLSSLCWSLLMRPPQLVRSALSSGSSLFTSVASSKVDQ